MKKIALVVFSGLFLALLFFIFLSAKKRSDADKIQKSPKNEEISPTPSRGVFREGVGIKNMGDLKISSPSFQDGDKIPARYTCLGENISPAIQIDGTPEKTESLVLIVDDPDATDGKTWDHWLVWNIAPETTLIPEGEVLAGAVSGATSFGDKKYGGPCPPPGSGVHHYRFKLYALDSVLNLPPESLKRQVEKAMEGHILDETILTGLYERS